MVQKFITHETSVWIRFINVWYHSRHVSHPSQGVNPRQGLALMFETLILDVFVQQMDHLSQPHKYDILKVLQKKSSIFDKH